MRAVRVAKRLYIGNSALMCVAGLLFMLVPVASLKVVCIALGILMLVFAANKLTGYFSNDQYGLAFQFDLALGIFVAAIGLMLLVHPDRAISAVSVLLGLFVLIDGGSKVQTALDARRFGLRAWWLILAWAILSAIAAMLLIFYPNDSARVLMILAGVTLLIDGSLNLFGSLYMVRTANRRRAPRLEE